MSSLKTQTIHTTTPYKYTYSFDFNFNPYDKILTKSNVRCYINYEEIDDFTVDFVNKKITFIGQGIEEIDRVDENSINSPNDGFSLIIARNTDISKPSVVFSESKRFNVKYINLVTNQLLYKQQELEEQVLFLREQLKSVSQFNEDDFTRVTNELLSLKNRIIELTNDFTDINALFSTLLSNYNALGNDYSTLLSNFNQLASNYASLLDDYSSFIDTYNLALDEMIDVTEQMQLIVISLQQQINELVFDQWRLGQVIQLHPTIAEQNKTRLLLAGGQSYFDTNPQVSELKTIYPSNGGMITMPNLINDFILDYVSVYIVKSETGIAGTGLE